MLYPLSKLETGRKAEIFWLSDHKSISVRLRDLGFEPGVSVTCMLRRSGGELAAFLVKGAVIALRREDAEIVLVCDGGDSGLFGDSGFISDSGRDDDSGLAGDSTRGGSRGKGGTL